MRLRLPKVSRGQAMTPTFFGIMAILAASLLGLRKSAWRPYLELTLFVFGVTIGFGGLGIALYKHTQETGQPWGWESLVSHWPSGNTWESLFWHGWPAGVAVGVAGHWWWRFNKWNRWDKREK